MINPIQIIYKEVRKMKYVLERIITWFRISLEEFNSYLKKVNIFLHYKKT